MFFFFFRGLVKFEKRTALDYFLYYLIAFALDRMYILNVQFTYAFVILNIYYYGMVNSATHRSTNENHPYGISTPFIGLT